MLSIPKHGWVDITIGDWTDRASYLTNFPEELINALISNLQSHIPSTGKCDAEGWENIIIFDTYTIHIITDKFESYASVAENPEIEYKLLSFDHHIKDIAEEVYQDISENLYAWSLWDYNAENEFIRVGNEKQLSRQLMMLRDAIDNY